MTLGELISKKRIELGYKKIQLSKLLGVGDDTLRSWEKGKFKPAGKNKDMIIKILKFSKQEASVYLSRN